MCHMEFDSLWLSLGKDSLDPCALLYLEQFIAVVEFHIAQSAWLMQTLLRHCGGRDVEAFEYHVFDALVKAVPTTSEVAVYHLKQFGS